jgi:hypothetical protein
MDVALLGADGISDLNERQKRLLGSLELAQAEAEQ